VFSGDIGNGKRARGRHPWMQYDLSPMVIKYSHFNTPATTEQKAITCELYLNYFIYYPRYPGYSLHALYVRRMIIYI